MLSPVSCGNQLGDAFLLVGIVVIISVVNYRGSFVKIREISDQNLTSERVYYS